MSKPKIRFNGFTEDWEQCKLEDICESFEYGLNAAAKEYDGENKYIRITDIDDNSREFLQGNVTSPDTELAGAENYCLKYGDILFARTGASVGKTYLYKDSDGLVYYAGFLIRGRIKDGFAPEFVFQNTLTEDYEKFIRITSQRSGQPGVNAQEYAGYKIFMPTYEEQKKIGQYFSNLDALITLHQRKCEQTKKLKKFMLQKMFPQNGATVPEIRFEGFTDDWEQRKFEDDNDLIMGFPFESEKYVENGIKLIRGMNVKRGILDLSDDICVRWGSSEGLENYLLEDGDILIQMDGALIGKSYARISQNQLPALLVQRVARARTKKDLACADFMYQTIQKDFLMFIKLNKTETAVPHLSLNDIKNFNIMVPSLEEQIKIGAYFYHLDHLITLHQRKCDELKNMKKFMLQNMFV